MTLSPSLFSQPEPGQENDQGRSSILHLLSVQVWRMVQQVVKIGEPQPGKSLYLGGGGGGGGGPLGGARVVITKGT